MVFSSWVKKKRKEVKNDFGALLFLSPVWDEKVIVPRHLMGSDLQHRDLDLVPDIVNTDGSLLHTCSELSTLLMKHLFLLLSGRIEVTKDQDN